MQGFNWTEKSAARNQLTEKYEPVQPLLLFEFLSAIGATCFVDVGANIGYYAILMSQLPGCEEIFAFEASADTFSHLADNVVINGLGNKIRCIQKAVSSSDGTLQFQIESELSGINSVVGTSMHRKELFGSVVSVEACTINSLAIASEKAIGFKIDVEGHELEVLKGADQTLTRNKCVLQLELYGNRVEETHYLLKTMGYCKIFSAGHDHYYSNVPSLFTPQVILKVVEAAMARTIEFNIGKWPKPLNVPKVIVTATSNSGKITASCKIEGQPLGDALEFAFYVIANGQRIYTRWYEPDANFVFDLPAAYRDKEIIVQGFVRDAVQQSRNVVGKNYAKQI